MTSRVATFGRIDGYTASAQFAWSSGARWPTQSNVTAWPGERSALLEVRSRYQTLTPREREVMSFLVKGLLNKQVAAELGMTLPTVKFHRAHLLEKMTADSIAELGRMSERLEAHGDEGSAT